MTEQASLFNKEINPLLQSGVILLLSTAIALIGSLLGLDAEGKFGTIFPWSMSASCLLFFVIFNSAFSFSYNNQNKYWILSIIGYVGLVVIGGYISYYLSGLSITEAKSMKTIYIIFTIGYVVLLTIVRSMRTILQIVLKQDKRLRGEE